MKQVRRSIGLAITVIAMACVMTVGGPTVSQAAGTDVTSMGKHLLETVRGFQAIYKIAILPDAKESGVQLYDHKQFVHTAAMQIQGFNLGYVELNPSSDVYRAKSEAEVKILNQMARKLNHEITMFRDGNQVKGLAGDYDNEKGLLGAYVIRIQE